MPRTTTELYNCWNRGRKRSKRTLWWNTIPARIWWTPWKIRNIRCFEDEANSTQEINFNRTCLLSFFCIEEFVNKAGAILMPLNIL